MGHTVGIDLGTTFCAVAKLTELGKPEIITNRDGENVTPSVVLFQEELPIVGTMAKRSAASSPLDVVQFVKRNMGDTGWRFETSGGTAYRPEEISAIILKRLKEDAELALGGEVTDAVITVPAYFDDAPRRATMDAGRIAGLNVRRVLNEPTAAALAHGLEATSDPAALRSGHDGTVLVYDLGGGTFDVTVMRVANGEFDVLGTHGDRNLGGFDFDNLLMKLLDEKFREQGGPSLLEDEVAEVDLRDKAEIAKHSLTSVEQTRVVIAADGVSKVLPVRRAEFEDVTAGLLGRTRDIATMVVEDAGLGWGDIDRVLLAGGSTRMPCVRAMMTELSGREPERAVNPDEVVALGAAIQAHLTDVDTAEPDEREHLPMLAGGMTPRVRDVTSQGLGTVALKRSATHDDDTENVVIIPANARIPARQSRVFDTVAEAQTKLRVEVTQGDDTDPGYVRMVGEQTLAIPPYEKGSPFEVVYAYDSDQIIQIEVTDQTTGKRVGNFEVRNVANMGEGEVSAAAEKMRTREVV